MAQKKAHEVDAWLARPNPAVRLVLIYGPDRGLVSERARTFAAATGLSADDPFAVVRLDVGETSGDQRGRLLDEAATVPMFSDKRLIWVRGAGAQKPFADEVKLLAADPPASALVLIEAGDLKKGSALRAAIEQARTGMALPCYADDARALDALIDTQLQSFGLSIGMEARQLLKASLGGDRLASRGEMEKLALYCMGQSAIEVEDVRLLIGDVSGLGADEAVDFVLTGRLAEFDRMFSRLLAAGTHPFVVLSAALRQFQALQAMRHAMDSEAKSAASVVASARPPIFFARKRVVEDALKAWSANALQHAASRLQTAILRTRAAPTMATAVARQVLLGIAVEGARAARRA